MKTINYFVLITLIILCSCKSGNASGQEKAEVKDSIRKFVYTEIPTMYTEPEQRANFLAKHYWENFNFADTNYINLPEVTEQAWADFLNILPITSPDTAGEAIETVFKKAAVDKKMYRHFIDLADKYLYDPNSPFRNEEYYISVLESMINGDVLEDIEKIRPKDRLNMAFKNRLGTKATNFTYTLESGKQGTLYSIKTEYTLVFFNNPGCSACLEAIDQMKFSLPILQGVMDKKITILAMYADEDKEEWSKHKKDIPKEWINGYDKSFIIESKRLYNLRAMPSLYLLDKEKKVLLKDTTVSAIEAYLKNK
ncbi:DUF5106 domain-containing protein [Bacteroides sp. 224]|uniref:DUF5106 domain-containing protein n=1 Tax=Bacteroides sp. 224 TaxID=2302936 RepID=UPI0013D53E21|nr:DUF5106 domain-containing protein [Bacteroides sp. 224]NDV64863.1 DUF5106 domain-containing protein [Bacteroides sp. 224]